MSINNLTIVRGKFEPVRETAYGDITTDFTMIGSTFDVNFSVVYVQNQTDGIMDFSISYDGVDTAFSLAPGGTLSTDMIANQIQISAGEAAWVKYRTSPSTGFVQVSAVTPV